MCRHTQKSKKGLTKIGTSYEEERLMMDAHVLANLSHTHLFTGKRNLFWKIM